MCSVTILSPKVKAYILHDKKLRKHLDSPAAAGVVGTVDDGRGGGGGEGGSPRESPDDSVEVLCGDRVLEPHLYIGERRKEGRGGGWGSRQSSPYYALNSKSAFWCGVVWCGVVWCGAR